MASLRQIKRRMKSIENIHEITKAMEMIAAFRFKKAEGRFSRSRAYFQEMEKLVSNLSSSAEELSHPLFEKRAIKKKTLMVIAGDKGLCGAYNANVLRAASGWLSQNREFETRVIPVGKVAQDFYRKRQIPTALGYAEKSMVDPALAKRVTEESKDLFLKGGTDSLEILYTSFRVGGGVQNRVHPFLSLGFLIQPGEKASEAAKYLYEPGFGEVFISLLEKYLEGKMYMILLESVTSEYLARMMAMKQATENGEEVLDELKLLRNKTRQAVITRELSEIVSGASVLV